MKVSLTLNIAGSEYVLKLDGFTRLSEVVEKLVKIERLAD